MHHIIDAFTLSSLSRYARAAPVWTRARGESHTPHRPTGARARARADDVLLQHGESCMCV